MYLKKIILTLLVLCLFQSVRAQNTDNDDKKYQIGLMGALAVNWNRPQTVNLESEKAGVGFHGGLSFKYFFGEHNNIGISSGVFFDAETFKVNYLPSTAKDSIYYSYEDKEITQFKDEPSDSTLVLLRERTYKPIYLTIPLTLQFQTNQIGYFRYFGRFGIDASILLNTKVNDVVTTANGDYSLQDPDSRQTLEKLNTENELQFIKSNLLIGAGMNWFFSGSTALHAEISYHFGYTNILKGKSRSLYNDDYIAFDEKVTQNKLTFKVGILF